MRRRTFRRRTNNSSPAPPNWKVRLHPNRPRILQLFQARRLRVNSTGICSSAPDAATMTPQNEENLPSAGAFDRKRPPLSLRHAVPAPRCLMADIYVLVDGDDTYDATSVARLIEPLLYGQVDMVNAVRVATVKDAYRPGHIFGNALLTGFISLNFSSECT